MESDDEEDVVNICISVESYSIPNNKDYLYGDYYCYFVSSLSLS